MQTIVNIFFVFYMIFYPTIAPNVHLGLLKP
jgi:hypothetical protein